ncbi:MAG: hypothetical protein JKY32_00800 [Rhizobiales bacterium]|nr:hypothetical protein [Hyphomicrobiales bacterium]
MSTILQVLLGSAALCLCAVWHIFALSELIFRLRARFENRTWSARGNFPVTVLIFLAILFAHTAQLYFWAGSFWLLGALPAFQDALYFSLVTYTTLGYGDIVVGEGFRVFAAMEAITGVLMFGISTAFLVGYFSEMMRSRLQ